MIRTALLTVFAVVITGCASKREYSVFVANESETPLTAVRVKIGDSVHEYPALHREPIESFALKGRRGKAPDSVHVTWTTGSGETKTAILRVPQMLREFRSYGIQFSQDGNTVDGHYVIMPEDTGFTSDTPFQQLFDSSDTSRRKFIGFE